MHSTTLRGSDFALTWQGSGVEHAAFFAAFRATDRVGIVSPAPFDGLGAITLAMAYVTAFYDRYRARGAGFFAYPDFYTFQRQTPPADYAMCDFWPVHKNVAIPEAASPALEAIVDRAVGILLVPEREACPTAFEPATAESARRGIQRCFLYAPEGVVDGADLAIACAEEPLAGYAQAVFSSAPRHDPDGRLQAAWRARIGSGRLRQTFREISLDEALARL